MEGKFISPLEMYLPGLVPRPVRDAHFQMVLPLKWADESERPMCIHFAGTGDHVRTYRISNSFLNANQVSYHKCSIIGGDAISWQSH